MSTTRAHLSAALTFSEALKPQAAAVGEEIGKMEVSEHPPLGGEALKPLAARSDCLLPSAAQMLDECLKVPRTTNMMLVHDAELLLP